MERLSSGGMRGAHGWAGARARGVNTQGHGHTHEFFSLVRLVTSRRSSATRDQGATSVKETMKAFQCSSNVATCVIKGAGGPKMPNMFFAQTVQTLLTQH